MKYQSVKLSDIAYETINELLGCGDENLKFLECLYDVDIAYRDDEFMLFCDDKQLLTIFEEHLKLLLDLIASGKDIDLNIIKQTFLELTGESFIDNSYKKKVIAHTFNHKPIICKTYNQAKLINSIALNDLVFAIGPAGTGKTYLAIVAAVNAFKNGQIKKIILTRPAVEAGESLGFLPGDLKDKIDPYLMPLYDSLHDIIGEEQTQKLMEKNAIEIIPLAYMRGRTLNDAYVILDEAQNTTRGQMLMFLTRLGHDSKMIVTGDITQIDLKINSRSSGLVAAKERLKGVEKIDFIEFSNDDIVRNPLVQKIIERFDEK